MGTMMYESDHGELHVLGLNYTDWSFTIANCGVAVLEKRRYWPPDGPHARAATAGSFVLLTVSIW